MLNHLLNWLRPPRNQTADRRPPPSRRCRPQVEVLEKREVPAAVLDKSFGLGGMMVNRVGFPNATITAIARQADGKFVAVGNAQDTDGDWDFVVTRYGANGRLDRSFGTNGTVRIDFAGGDDGAEAVRVLKSGKILVGGWATSEGDSDFAMARLLADGRLDGRFGNRGKVLADFGQGDDYALGMAVVSDGRILLAGRAQNAAGNADLALARFGPNGGRDVTFGMAGKVITDVAGSYDNINDLIVLPTGKLLVGGVATMATRNTDMLLARYHANGSLDRGFGRAGLVTRDLGGSFEEIYDLARQQDGKLVAAGYRYRAADGAAFIVTRFKAGGGLDPTFGGTGYVRVNFGSTWEYAFAVGIDGAGRIVAAGTTYTGSRGADFAVARLRADGKLNQRFTSDFARQNDEAYGMLVLADGRLVTAGVSQSADGNRFALAGYQFVRTVTTNRTNNLAPVANAGGQYLVSSTSGFRLQTGVQLDASASYDRDQVVGMRYQWDLNGNGVYGETGAAATRGDEVGLYPVFRTEGLEPGSYTVSLRVTDALGLGSLASALVTIQ